MEVNNSATERAGSKEKISKWKLYKTQIKRLKESSKQEVPTVAKVDESQGEVLLDSGSGIDITLNTGDTSEAEAGQAEKQAEASSATDIYYPPPPSQEKSSKWSALRNTMHFIRAARPRVRSHSFPAEASQVDSLPSSFSHLYKGNKTTSQPFQLNLATQEEIYEIMGEEVNLYLSGVNRRLSTRLTPSVPDQYEPSGS